MTALTLYQTWLDYPHLAASLKAELLEIQGNEEEIKERFSTSMEFGTGGIRGILRAGTNGMNVYTVCQGSALLMIPVIFPMCLPKNPQWCWRQTVLRCTYSRRFAPLPCCPLPSVK